MIVIALKPMEIFYATQLCSHFFQEWLHWLSVLYLSYVQLFSVLFSGHFY